MKRILLLFCLCYFNLIQVSAQSCNPSAGACGCGFSLLSISQTSGQNAGSFVFNSCDAYGIHWEMKTSGGTIVASGEAAPTSSTISFTLPSGIATGTYVFTACVTKNNPAGTSTCNGNSSISFPFTAPSGGSGGGTNVSNLGQYVGVNTSNTGQSFTGLGAFNLVVNGKVIANEIRVRTGWADFVFNEDHKLPKITEVEGFIQKNGHLAGMPASNIVEEQGISIGEMNAKLLQKIEELTLYLIDQNKRIEKLKKRHLK